MAIWIQSLSWALLYSLAQGCAVYVVLRLILRIVPASLANARYHLGLSALTIMLGLFAATWWQQYNMLALAREEMAAGMAGATVIWLPWQDASLNGGAGNWRALPSSVEAWFPLICTVYIAGLAVMLVRFPAGLVHLLRLRTEDTIPADAGLHALLTAQKMRLHLYRPVKLLISARAQAPMVIGFLKPVILVPMATIAQLETHELETILLHELAHIKRHDYLVNILQTIVETILFFNPFVWLTSSIVRQEREHCCDDMVVNNTPEPISYATALAAIAAHRPTLPHIAVAATGQPNHLYNRIQRFMEMKKTPFSYSRMVAAMIMIAGISVSLAWIKPAFTGGKNDKEAGGLQKAASVIPANATEEDQLMLRLLDDQKVDQVRGFVVEKRLGDLLINGRQQSPEVAQKYLAGLKKEYIRVQVFSLDERMKMHPGAGFIQLLLPATFSSGCIDKSSGKKEGC